MFWATGANVQADEFYTISFGQPYNPFDGIIPEPSIGDASGVAFPSPKGPRPTLRFEWMREGRDDFRYIDLLQRLIIEAKKSKLQKIRIKAEEAESFLKKIRDSISINLNDYWQGKKRWWSLTQYDLYRKEIASRIIELQRILKFKDIKMD